MEIAVERYAEPVWYILNVKIGGLVNRDLKPEEAICARVRPMSGREMDSFVESESQMVRGDPGFNIASKARRLTEREISERVVELRNLTFNVEQADGTRKPFSPKNGEDLLELFRTQDIPSDWQDAIVKDLTMAIESASVLRDGLLDRRRPH